MVRTIVLLNAGKVANVATLAEGAPIPEAWFEIYDEVVEPATEEELRALLTPEPDPVAPVFRLVSSSTSPWEEQLTSEWSELGMLTTMVEFLGDFDRCFGGIVANVRMTGGSVLLRLRGHPVDGSGPVTLAEGVIESSSPYTRLRTAPGGLIRGPCEYVAEGKLGTATTGSVRGTTLALYEMQS
jgi:hypothetical protein